MYVQWSAGKGSQIDPQKMMSKHSPGKNRHRTHIKHKRPGGGAEMKKKKKICGKEKFKILNITCRERSCTTTTLVYRVSIEKSSASAKRDSASRVYGDRTLYLLPGSIVTAICRLRSWRHPPSGISRSPQARRRAPTQVATAIRRAGRHPSSLIPAERRTWARRATPSELRHGDRLARDALVERLRDGPAVRVVEGCLRVVAVRLVWVQMGKRRDSVRVWV